MGTASYHPGVTRARWLLGIEVVIGIAAAGCVGSERPPSIWPPEDFLLVVEEVRQDGDAMHVLRQLRVDDRGVVVYGTSAEPLVDLQSGVSLPVFDRLSVYRLEPTSARSLARSLARLGIADWTPPARAGDGPLGLSISWRAFGGQHALGSVGRPRGRLAEILALVASYLPPGESFDAALRRPVVPVLRGVPQPRRDLEGARSALGDQLAERPDDATLLINAFALACRAGDRTAAERLLERWVAARLAEVGAEVDAFADDPEDAPARQAEVLRRLLPAARQLPAVARVAALRRKTSKE